MRMRTQSEAYKAIKEADPETALTPHALRKMILTGRIPSVTVGKKYLIDLDRLEECLAEPPAAVNEKRGSIRPISF